MLGAGIAAGAVEALGPVALRHSSTPPSSAIASAAKRHCLPICEDLDSA